MNANSPDKLSSIYVPLHLAYGLVPIVAGADKFLHLLTDWNKYLPAAVAERLPLPAATFMMIVGVIEIVAGVAVLVLPRVGSLIVALWLVAISVNLILGGFYDIAVRDLMMALGAYVLFQVAALRGEHWIPRAAHPQGTPVHVGAR